MGAMPSILLHDDLILYEIGICHPPFFGLSKKCRNGKNVHDLKKENNSRALYKWNIPLF